MSTLTIACAADQHSIALESVYLHDSLSSSVQIMVLGTLLSELSVRKPVSTIVSPRGQTETEQVLVDISDMDAMLLQLMVLLI
jgi:hypothetical protein